MKQKLVVKWLIPCILALCGLGIAIAFGQSSARFGTLSTGNPLHYARLHFDGNTTPLGMSAKDTWYVIKGFIPGGTQGWSYDVGTGELCALDGSRGAYAVVFSMSIEGNPGVGIEYEFAIKQNGLTVAGCLILEGTGGGLSEVEHIAQPCQVIVEVGDEFTLEAVNRTNNNDVIIRSATVTAHRL
jgi:hypothetical protein